MCCLTLQGSTLRHCFSKTLVISQASWQHIPETEIFSHCHKNLLSHRAYATLISTDALNFAPYETEAMHCPKSCSYALSQHWSLQTYSGVIQSGFFTCAVSMTLYQPSGACLPFSVTAILSVWIQEGIAWYWKLRVPILQNAISHAPNHIFIFILPPHEWDHIISLQTQGRIALNITIQNSPSLSIISAMCSPKLYVRYRTKGSKTTVGVRALPSVAQYGGSPPTPPYSCKMPILLW